jgi:uncharacterized membrane-anchored protein
MTDEIKSTGDITEARAHAFAALRDLRAKKIDTDTARAVAALIGEITDTARVEVEFARVTGQTTTSGFLPLEAARTEALPPGITGIRRHRLEG